MGCIRARFHPNCLLQKKKTTQQTITQSAAADTQLPIFEKHSLCNSEGVYNAFSRRKLPADGLLSLSGNYARHMSSSKSFNINLSLPHRVSKSKGIQTVIYSRMASKRPSFIPATFIISSITVKPPLFSRKLIIASAVVSPTPGSVSSAL